ncbi:MAG TPA: TldD/PmbA family protein [Solirubrobacterales bacterium]|nr:TldD/PmbA family protein [Solirubrobacterales bacterium]
MSEHLPSVDLSPAAGRAVEVALGAGASAAEAYASRDTGREVRVHGGEVESLTAATQSGIGIRAWDGHRVGYAFGTDLSEAGVAALAARAAEMAAAADEDEFAAPPAPAEIEALAGLDSPSVAEWDAGQVADLALTVERTALAADPRVTGVETAVYADSTEQVAIASSTGIAASYETSNCFAYLQALAADEGGRETGLGFGLARGPEDLDPEAIGAEGAERAVSMIGAGKPASRSCPVVLDPTVAASFALHDDGRDPAGAASAPFDGEGVPRRRTALIEGGALRSYLYDTYTANREGTASTGSAARAGYRSLPSVAASNLVVTAGDLSTEALLAEAGDGVFVTDVAGLHSGVNPVSGTFSVGATGRLIEGGELGAPAREMTIASDLVSMLKAVQAVGSSSR